MKLTQWLLAGIGMCISGAVLAQAYPSRPIRVVVPWPPGQATDLAARIVGERLSQSMGQPAPLTDLAPISVVALNPFALVTFPGFPAANAREFVAKLKAEPGLHTFSSSGTGATAHLIVEYFNSVAEVQARHIPYKGSVPSLTDLMGGQVDYTFETIPSVAQQIKNGRLKTYGVSSSRRSSAMPDVPTIAEAANLPGFDIGSWMGYMGPAGLPKEIADKLAAEIKKAVASPLTHEQYLTLGMEQVSQTPAEMSAMLKREQDRFAAIIKKNNIRIE